MMSKELLSRMLGPEGEGTVRAMRLGRDFLSRHGPEELLPLVGRRVEEIPRFRPVSKRPLQKSYGGGDSAPADDLLVGKGMFYLTEGGRLFLDCTAGHYQMVWGYNDGELCRAVAEAVEDGLAWDNHSNIPQAPVKALAHKLIELANPPDEKDPLDTVHLGCCTGSVACAAALKIQLLCFQRRDPSGKPVMVVLDGNYHGTDMVAQHLRGMWPGLVAGVEVAAVQPNDEAELEAVFRRLGPRVAGFWAEPILMNREAIPLSASYLQLARRLCDECGALMAIDEIQTGFWQPEVFAYRSLGITPDLVIAGKGMTAGFHPLSAVIYKRRLDVLAQYDAISTNGSASLPSYVALLCIDRILSQAGRIIEVGDRFARGLDALAKGSPELLRDARGKRHMMGLKFHRVADAQSFHRRALEGGLWARVHAYHEGHSTVLTKLALPADERIVDFVLERFAALLRPAVAVR